MHEAFIGYVDDVGLHKIDTERMIVYCNTFKQCCDVRDFSENCKSADFIILIFP